MDKHFQLILDAARENGSFETVLDGFRITVSRDLPETSSSKTPCPASPAAETPSKEELTCPPCVSSAVRAQRCTGAIKWNHRVDLGHVVGAPANVRFAILAFLGGSESVQDRIYAEAVRLYDIAQKAFPPEEPYYLAQDTMLRDAFQNLPHDTQQFLNLLWKHEKGMPLSPPRKIEFTPDLVVVPLQATDRHNYELGVPHLHYADGVFYHFGIPTLKGNHMTSLRASLRAPFLEEIVALLMIRDEA